MAVLTRAEILARKVHGRTERVPFPTPDSEDWLAVRGLSRAEAQETVGKSVPELEALIVWYGLVQPDDMTLDDVKAWMANDESGAFEPVIAMINALSGNAPGQGKEYTKSVSGQ